MPPRNRLLEALREHLVPLLFALVCVAGIAISDRRPSFFVNDVIERTARNAFIVLSLVIPVVAGLGLNFGIVLGAMAGEVGIIVAESRGVEGGKGLALAMGVSVPVSIALGLLAGALMNRAKGREMVAGLILGFLANGIYQAIFLLLAGPVIPIPNEELLLPSGTGLRNMIDLEAIGDALPRTALSWGEGPSRVNIGLPWAVYAITAALAVLLAWLQKTKLGQELRAVGQDRHVAEVLGIDVDRRRLAAMVLSTVLGGLGMVLYVLDLGTLNTYQSHEQIGFYAIAALLVGGASVTRATVGQALAGTALFHTLVPVLTEVCQKKLGSPQLGEFLRELTAYTIIGATLAIHAWKKAREHRAQGVP